MSAPGTNLGLSNVRPHPSLERAKHHQSIDRAAGARRRAAGGPPSRSRCGAQAIWATQAGLKRTMGRRGLRRATSLKPALSYIDLAPNHMASSLERRGLVDRIGLDQRDAAFLGVCDSSREERLRHALAAILGRHDKADDRPDGWLIDGLHDRRALEPGNGRPSILWR